MLFLYRILTNIIIILSPLIIIYRLLKKKEHHRRFLEKFCITSSKKLNGKLIWFHGSSVGEILSIVPLIEKLNKRNDIRQILVTSSTLSSSFVLKNIKLKKVVHQFFPIDTKYFSKKFLNYWKPSVAIFIESEIWPNMINNIKEKSIPLILLNARITKKSFDRWKSIPRFSEKIFRSFDFTYPQNIETKKYLKILGAKKIKIIGNLKFSENEVSHSNDIKYNLKKFFNNKKIWCAASTHDTEEEICAQTHKKLKTKYNKLLTIIIPRHVHRAKKIVDEIKRLGLQVHLHSSNNKVKKNTEIYLVDTYGETKSFFKICKTVFLGGSIIQHGGQNPLESIRFGCNVIHGPNVNNFREIYNLLEINDLSIKINNSNQLTEALNKSFRKKGSSVEKIRRLKKLGKKILNTTYNEIEYYIKENEYKKT